MKERISVIIVFAAAIVLSGCQGMLPGGRGAVVFGSGQVISEPRQVSGFSAVSLSGVGLLTIAQGETESLTVEAEDNLMPLIKTQVKEGTLFILVDKDGRYASMVPTRSINYHLIVKELNRIDLSGAGNVESDNLKNDRMQVNISGAGNVRIKQLQATDITTRLSGAGSMDVAGNVVSQAAEINGVGNYHADGLNSQRAQVSVSGAGGAVLWTQDNLAVTISGAGSVGYYGAPKVAQRIAGVGSVHKLGDK
jgi:hypothetical protein